MGLKCYYHYEDEKNSSIQQDETKLFRRDQTEFNSDVKSNGLEANLIRTNFVKGLFRIFYFIIVNWKYMFRNFCKIGKLSENERNNLTQMFDWKTERFKMISKICSKVIKRQKNYMEKWTISSWKSIV